MLEESTMRPNSSDEIVVVSNYLQLAAVFTRWSPRWKSVARARFIYFWQHTEYDLGSVFRSQTGIEAAL